MRLPSAFAATSLALLSGFTFAEHTTHLEADAFRGVPSYSDVLANAYETARDMIGGGLGPALTVEFPGTFDATARMTPLEADAFLVRSWVRVQGVTGTVATIPWSARVRCRVGTCSVEHATLERDHAR